MKIGHKLGVSFGILVLLTLMVAGLGYVSSEKAAAQIERTRKFQLPLVLTLTEAETHLFEMLSGVRGYLALGLEKYRDDYQAAGDAFQSNLILMEQLKKDCTIDGHGDKLKALKAAYHEWSKLPKELFHIRDDQLEREPALRMMMQEVQPALLFIIRDIRKVMRGFREMEPRHELFLLIEDVAGFQSSLYSMIAGLRAYITTGRDSFKFEYHANLEMNSEFLERMMRKKSTFLPAQRDLLESIEKNRARSLTYPDVIFDIVEGDAVRKDLFIYKTRALPFAEQMLKNLSDLVKSHETNLQNELEESSEKLAAARRQTFSGGALAILFGICLSFLLAGNFAGPIRRLIEVTRKIREGDFSVRAVVESNDEIGRLAGTFNRMAEKLQITMEDLKQAKEAAEAASRAKSAFLANISHELRTPLNAVIGYSELMEMNSALSEDEKKNMKSIRSSGEHLLTLINQVLDMSAIEHGALPLEMHETDLCRLLRDVLDMFRMKTVKKGLALQMTCSPDLPEWILTDSMRLRQILINMLGNAVKFTESGSVSLHVSIISQSLSQDLQAICEEGEMKKKTTDLETKKIENLEIETTDIKSKASKKIRFEVKDSGPGIAPDEIDGLFQSFSQTRTGRASEEGSGLGLAISRQFARMMGGEIFVTSKVGFGTTFVLEIPCCFVQNLNDASAMDFKKSYGYGDGDTAQRETPMEISTYDRVCSQQAALLPSHLVNELIGACRIADMEKIALKIDETASYSQEFAERLRSLADHFEYEKILNILSVSE